MEIRTTKSSRQRQVRCATMSFDNHPDRAVGDPGKEEAALHPEYSQHGSDMDELERLGRNIGRLAARA
ncbi:Uncharacterised protein [Nocardia otitidiscaviarum]|uniref:Uncharacterized protein n=1 Tax=Nocardia otitidiscaviarum TaxID=1823 RepID=A0A379JLD0_9NOCA|nr:Uncharacterised protein [Nocardia otitidiscaviarum]